MKQSINISTCNGESYVTLTEKIKSHVSYLKKERKKNPKSFVERAYTDYYRRTNAYI